VNLISQDSITLTRQHHIDAAAVQGAFYSHLTQQIPNFSGEVEVGFDALLGGCQWMAIYAVQTLDPMIDWEAYGEIGGVFSYEYLEADMALSDLAGYLLVHITISDWVEISGNYMVPDLPDMQRLLTAWATGRHLPLNKAGKPDGRATHDPVLGQQKGPA
jgi:hypothetical protein